jgi:hypothetical protein
MLASSGHMHYIYKHLCQKGLSSNAFPKRETKLSKSYYSANQYITRSNSVLLDYTRNL